MPDIEFTPPIESVSASPPPYVPVFKANGSEIDPERAARREAIEIRAAASVVLERVQFLRQAGITFKGDRDLYEVLGYDRIITTRQYRDRYARGGIAKRVVEAFPKATWRGGGSLIEDEDPQISTPFEDAWESLEKRLSVWATLQRADILAGLSTYAVVLIGAPGELYTELPKGKGPDSLLYLSPFCGGGGPSFGNNKTQVSAFDSDCTIQEYEVDTASPRFGLPKSYMLRRTSFSVDFGPSVHWTRIIHIAENTLDDEVFGQPTLENVWNLLDDLEKVTGGGAEAFWLRANQGLHINFDKDMKDLDPPEIEKLKENLEQYKHGLDRWIRTRGTEINTLGSDVANFSNPSDAILTQIAGARAIPKRILTGSEMGELASSQDRDNWKDQINGRQTGYAGPFIVRRLADRLIKYGYLPTPSKGPDAYEVQWPHIQVLTESERSTGAKDWAGVNQTAGVTVFTADEIRDKWYALEPGEGQDSEHEKWRYEGATAWANINKEMGKVIFTDDEIRKKWYDYDPLPEDQKVPIAAPEKAVAPGAGGAPAAPVDKAAPFPKAAEETPELLLVLAEAIRCNNTEVIDQILGLNHATMTTAGGPGSGDYGHAGRPGEIGGSSGATAGFRIPTKADAKRLAELKVPPTWTNVHINPDPKGRLQVVGIDSKGRRQPIYSAEHHAKQSAVKFDRETEFNKERPKLMAKVNRDLKSGDPDVREQAAVIKTIDKTAFRIGGEGDTKAEKQAFGAMTLRAKNVSIDGDEVTFKFTAKSGKQVEKTVEDKELAALLKPRVEKGGRLFDTNYYAVRDYMKENAPGFTPKDFRTWHGTSLAIKTMRGMAAPDTADEFKSSRNEVAKIVAEHLGNTPKVALRSYISPEVWDRWDTRGRNR